MFQNAKLAKDAGHKVTMKAAKAGIPSGQAVLMGRMAEAKELKRLNAWTKATVGLN